MKVLCAVRFGRLCAACTGGRCVDEPSTKSPGVFGSAQCPDCARAGRLSRDCPTCHGWGKADVVVSCPHKGITPELYDVPMTADLVGKGGGWPSGRGWLNEPASCVQAVREWWSLEAFWRAEIEKKD